MSYCVSFQHSQTNSTQLCTTGMTMYTTGALTSWQ